MVTRVRVPLSYAHRTNGRWACPCCFTLRIVWWLRLRNSEDERAAADQLQGFCAPQRFKVAEVIARKCKRAPTPQGIGTLCLSCLHGSERSGTATCRPRAFLSCLLGSEPGRTGYQPATAFLSCLHGSEPRPASSAAAGPFLSCLHGSEPALQLPGLFT